MKKYIKLISLFTVFLISLFLLFNPLSEPRAVDCSDTNMGGDYTVTTNCAFASDGTTTTVADSSTNASTGTPTGTTIVTGKYGSARSFNGSSDYISIPSNSNLNPTSAITITAWVKPDDAARSTWQEFVAKGPSSDRQYFLRPKTNDGLLQGAIYLSDQSIRYTTGVTPLQNATWSHVAMTYDASTGIVNLYINGVLDKSADTAGGSINTTTEILAIGRLGSTSAEYYDGSIDDVRIYNYVRSADQITEDMDNGSITGSVPVGHWKMDDGYTVGVDNGDITVASGNTLTVNAGQTVVWNPGKGITIENGASIAINATGQLKQSYLWVSDSDGDGWYYDSTQVVADSQPTGYVRRKDVIGSVFGDGSGGNVTFNTNTNLNTTNVEAGRTCSDGGDAVSYPVTSLTSNTATLSGASFDEGGIDTGDGADGTLTLITDTGDGADGTLTPNGAFNINTDASGGRTYADGIAVKVTANPTGTSITVDSSTGIAAGDEVLLINLQGNS